MLALEVVEEIKRLLVERRLSQRKIATLIGVSRGTVGAIATGRRRTHEKHGAEETAPAGPPARCAECGGYVYLPCVACRLRAKLAELKITRVPDGPMEPLGVNLVGPARQRYLWLYARQRQRDRQRDGRDPIFSCETEEPDEA